MHEKREDENIYQVFGAWSRPKNIWVRRFASEKQFWVEKESFLSRDKWENENWILPQLYIEKRSSMYWGFVRGAIEKKPRNLDGSRMSQGSVEQTKRSAEKLDGLACCWESIESKAKRLDKRGCVEVSVEKLSSLKKKSFSREEKHIKMNATCKLLKQRSAQYVKLSKHLSTYKQSIHRSKTHTLNKSNQFYIPKTS